LSDVLVERYWLGQEVAAPNGGDLLLIRGRSWASAFVYLLERLRPRELGAFGYWSHCAFVAGPTGLIVDVTNRGVVLRHISRYRDSEYHYVRLDLTDEQRLSAIRAAAACLGRPYSLASFFLIGWNNLTPFHWKVADRGQNVCASIVARALAPCGIEFDRPPHELLASDLARHFGVTPEARSPRARASRRRALAPRALLQLRRGGRTAA
jgi:hypothetical protein